MDNIGLSFALFIQTAIQMGTHLLYATIGGILCEKVGNTNLGIEGMMIMGASFGFSTAIKTGNPLFAVLIAGLAGAAGALIYAFITVTLRGNQVVTGLVLTIFGCGVAEFIGQSITGLALPETITRTFTPLQIPILSKIPFLGDAIFKQSIYVYIAPILAVIMYFYLKYTYVGLNTKAVGENPGAADASGVNVTLYKYVNILIGGFLCGIGGAYLSLVFVPRWQTNITAGAGWIAIALIIVSTWNPIKAIFIAYIFGALRGIGFKLQNTEILGLQVNIPSQLLDMIPYIATILVLMIITLRKKKEHQPPKWLGSAYFREER